MSAHSVPDDFWQNVTNRLEVASVQGAVNILALAIKDIQEHPDDDVIEYLTAVRDELIMRYPAVIES